MPHVINEARRCLNCKRPLCREGCPISTPIPDMIQTLLAGNIDEAGNMLFKNNPLSLVCSLVCNHEAQCEGHCILNRKGQPVHVSSIENYISSHYLDKMRSTPAKSNGTRVAIVGGGPAGITIAVILSSKGYGVTIFEDKEKIGGVLRYGIPEFRLPRTILDRYHQELVAMGVQIRPNITIGNALSIDDLFRDGYQAVFIGTGVWKPHTLGIKGESLGNVHYAIDYLCNPDVYNLGQRVNVIGVGNAAMDAARTAIRKGVSQVTAFARRDKAAANETEQEYAAIEGVRFEYFKAPVELTEEGCIFQETKWDEDGKLVRIPGTEKLYPADSTIIAISQGPRTVIVNSSGGGGIDLNERGLVIVDELGHTTREGVFASGDVVSGAKTVVETVNYSKQVAEAMDQYLQSLSS